jgi:hypothetical protein
MGRRIPLGNMLSLTGSFSYPVHPPHLSFNDFEQRFGMSLYGSNHLNES